MLDLLLDQLLLLLAQVHLVHFLHQFVPGLFLFDFFGLLPSVFGLNIGLDSLSPLSCAIRWLYLLAGLSWLLLSSSGVPCHLPKVSETRRGSRLLIRDAYCCCAPAFWLEKAVPWTFCPVLRPSYCWALLILRAACSMLLLLAC